MFITFAVLNKTPFQYHVVLSIYLTPESFLVILIQGEHNSVKFYFTIRKINQTPWKKIILLLRENKEKKIISLFYIAL